MAAARIVAIRGVVYSDNTDPVEGRVCVEMTAPDGALISGTMTEPDGSFLLAVGAGVLLCHAEILLSVWRGNHRIKQLRLTTRDALSRNIWIPVDEATTIMKVCGVLREADGSPARNRKVRVLRVISRLDGRLVKKKIGAGRTDAEGRFSIPCTCPRTEAVVPLLQIQAYDIHGMPAVCAMVHQSEMPIRPVSLVLPDEEPTLILDAPLVRMMA